MLVNYFLKTYNVVNGWFLPPIKIVILGLVYYWFYHIIAIPIRKSLD